MAEQQAQQQREAAAAASAKKAKKNRYIAVKTEKSPNNTGKAQVMIFDTQTNHVVGNDVYDLNATPKVGQVSKFDTYSAEYVAAGS